MKIVYTGGIYTPYFSTALMRMQVLEELGHETHPHCVVSYNDWLGRWGGAIFRRYLWGPPIHRYNRDLMALIHKVKPDMLWVDKGRWLFPKTLASIQSMGIKAVYYTPDAAFYHNQSRWLRGCLPLYDLVVTTKPYEVDLYKQHNVKRLVLKRPMFDARIHHPMKVSEEDKKRFGCDIVFIGTYTPGRDTYLIPLIEAGFDVAIWGNGWENCNNPSLTSCIRGTHISGTDYSKGLICAKIGLGLLNTLIPDTSTTRTVEIPAVGTFLLAERTQEHLEMFEENKEAEYFDSVDELLEKARYYLKHEEEREAIAAAGHKRAMSSGYDVTALLSEILQQTEQLPKAS